MKLGMVRVNGGPHPHALTVTCAEFGGPIKVTISGTGTLGNLLEKR
jgi:hypothetical protein